MLHEPNDSLQHTPPNWVGLFSQLIRCTFLFLSIVASLATSLTAQEAKVPTDPDWNFRYELLQILLQQHGMHGTDSLTDAIRTPKNSAIIFIGKGSALTTQGPLIKSYIHAGGRMLIAVDSLQCDGVAVVERGPAFAESLNDSFQNFSDCIILQNLSSTEPLTKSLASIVTNRTGWIESSSKDFHWQQLLALPQRTLPFDSRGRPIAILGKTTLNDAEGQVAPGGLVLLADPSVLSNGMLWYHDNGNFAARIANWLAEGKRPTYAMIVDESAQTDYPIEKLRSQAENAEQHELPAPPPPPNLDSLLPLANAAIKELADSKQINRQLQDQPRHVSPRRYAAMLWTGLAILIGALILRALLRRPAEYQPKHRDSSKSFGRELLHKSLPYDLQNKLAAESLSREFSKRWTNSDSESEWRVALDEMKDIPRSPLPPADRVQAEAILAIAVFGGRTMMSDAELENLGFWIQRLLTLYRTKESETVAHP